MVASSRIRCYAINVTSVVNVMSDSPTNTCLIIGIMNRFKLCIVSALVHILKHSQISH